MIGMEVYSAETAFSINLVRTKILQFLSLVEAKSCRLINSDWNFEARPIVYYRSCLSFELRENPDSENENKFAEMEINTSGSSALERKSRLSRYLEMEMMPGVRNVKFKVDHGSLGNRDVIHQLCSHYYQSLQMLDYTLWLKSSDEIVSFQCLLSKLPRLNKLRLVLSFGEALMYSTTIPEIFASCQFKSIIDLSLAFDFDVVHWEFYSNRISGEIYKTFCSLPNNFPNLQRLHIKKSPNVFISVMFSDEILEREEIQSQFNKLRCLVIGSPYVTSLDHLTFPEYKFNQNLTSLSIAFRGREISPGGIFGFSEMANAFEDLLWYHCNNLVVLDLRTCGIPHWGESINFVLPILPRLKKLRLIHTFATERPDSYDDCLNHYDYSYKFPTGEGSSSSRHLDYDKQFPLLEDLTFQVSYTFNNAKEEGCWPVSQIKPALLAFLPSKQTPRALCTTVKYFEILGVDNSELKPYFMRAVEIFPNVHNVIFNEIRKMKRDTPSTSKAAYF